MAVTNTGKIKKKFYCPNCFSILTWDDPKDEIDNNGNRSIICPVCNQKVNICPPAKVEIVEGE